MDLPSSINGDLVPSSNVQTRVVSRTVVHETFSSRGIGLFVDCALEGDFLGNSRMEIAGIRWFVYEKKIWGLCTRGEIGTASRNTVLQVGTGDGFSVERLDVKNDWDDVRL